jgi:hypothetical protein
MIIQTMKKFPCPICKGKGGDHEEWGFEECNYCEGEGMIEIKGKIHTKWKALNLGINIVTFVQPKGKDYLSTNELIKIGRKAMNLVK